MNLLTAKCKKPTRLVSSENIVLQVLIGASEIFGFPQNSSIGSRLRNVESRFGLNPTQSCSQNLQDVLLHAQGFTIYHVNLLIF